MSTVKTITIQRWYNNPEIWLNVATAVVNIASLAAASIGALGLGPVTLFYVSIGLALVTNAANIVVKMSTKTVVASAKTIEQIQEMPNTPSVETAPSNNAGTSATVELKTGR